MRLNWDQTALLLLKFTRMNAYGQTAIILVSFLSSIGWSDESIGLFMSFTLIGDVLVSMVVGAISHKDIIGRRALLRISSLMLFFSGIVFALSTNYWVLLSAAIVGVISPSGDEVGPFMSLESALIAQITPYSDRGYMFAIQGMLGTFGLALGLASGGWLAEHGDHLFGWVISGHRLIFWIYAGWAVVAFVLVCTLSSKCEIQEGDDAQVDASELLDECLENETTPLIREAEHEQDMIHEGQATAAPATPETSDDPLAAQEERIRKRSSEQKSLSSILCLIFGIDSLAYGFMTNSWLVEYMERRYKASTTLVGEFMFLSQFISALTSVPSVYFTQKVGPVLAIALTKFGAGAFGAAVPLSHNITQAMGCVLFRSLFDTMDVVPRQLFLTSAVPKEQTVAVLSLVNIVKTFARSIAPVGTGILAAQNLLWVAFVAMGLLEWVFGIAVIGFFY